MNNKFLIKLSVIALFLSVLSGTSYAQYRIRCPDPQCPLCLAIPGAVSKPTDTREPRNRPEDAPFGRTGSLAVVNPVIRSPHQTALSLAGEWEFCTDPGSVGVQEQWMRPDAAWTSSVAMPVPSNWESHGIGEPGMSTPWAITGDRIPRPLRHIYIGSAWYRKTISIPADWEGRRVWLKIGGVRAQGWFWVNGAPVARAFYFCGSYRYDVTDLVKPGETAVIVAQVRNDVPSRMGGVSACHIWGAISRDVELEATPEVFLSNVECFGNFDAKNVDVRCQLEHPHQAKGTSMDVEVSLRFAEGVSAQLAKTRFTVQLGEGGSTTVTRTVAPKVFRAWSPETPHLYVADVTLYERGSKTPVYGWTERFGVKKMEVRGDRFYLNNKPYFVRGYGDDYIYPATFISPTDRDVHRKNLRVAREAGFNYVRHHTHCEIPEFYDAADELGIMIQAELPYYCNERGNNTVEYFDFDPARDLNELIDHRRRHVSQTVYCGGNEGHLGYPLDNELKALVHQRDPGKLWMLNDGGINTPENSDFVSPSFCDPRHPVSTHVPWKPGTFDYLTTPFVAHEYLNLGLKFDPRISERFTGLILPPRPMAVYEKKLADLYIDRHWGDACLDAGHALQRYYQKQGLEQARLDPQCDGYSFWTLIDVIVNYGDGEHNFTGQGMFNPFYEPKSNGATPKDVVKFNGPTAILMQLEGREHPIFVEGDTVRASIFISHFGYDDLKNESVAWTIQSGNTTLVNGVIERVNMKTGDVRKTGEVQFVVPRRAHAEHWRLVTRLGNGATNDWDLWAFPKRQKKSLKGFAVTPRLYETFAKLYDGFAMAGTPEGDAAQIVVGTWECHETADAITAEKRVVMLGKADGEPNVQLGWWLIANQTGTAFAHHPAFGDFPHDGYISPLWFRLIKQGVQIRKALPFDKMEQLPILIKQDMPIANWLPFDKMEYLSVGEGRNDYFMYAALATVGEKGKALITQGLDVLSGTPEATYLLDKMLEYIASNH